MKRKEDKLKNATLRGFRSVVYEEGSPGPQFRPAIGPYILSLGNILNTPAADSIK